MRYIGIIILLVLCLTLLLLTGCVTNTITPEIASGNLENQEDINQSINNSQNLSISPIYEPVIEEPVIEEPGTVYPQKWATGTGTVGDPWANDCIQKAYDFMPAGGTIFLRAGYYQLADKIEITKQINIFGEGRDRTIIRTANAYGIMIETDYVSLKGFTVDGNAQTDDYTYNCCIRIGDCNYALLEDIEVMNAGVLGINIYQVNHSTFQNIYAHDNYSHGLHPGADEIGWNKYNTYRDIYAWNNGGLGFADRGTTTTPEEANNVYDNIQCWNNGFFGIEIANQKGGVLSNSLASGNTSIGISLLGLEDFNINNCLVTLNGVNEAQAIFLKSSENINLTNIIVKNNYTGIGIEDCSNIALTSCQSYDDRETPLQRYGLQLTETDTDISLLNCKLTPNSLGEIYNSAGVVVTVITEKMLAKF